MRENGKENLDNGYVDEELHQKAKFLKPIAYIYKPFDIQELVDKAEEAVS